MGEILIADGGGIFFCLKGADIGISDGILIVETAGILGYFFGAGRYDVLFAYRRNDGQFLHIFLPRLSVQHHRQLVGKTNIQFLVAVLVAFRSPDQQVAQSRGDRGLSGSIGILHGYRIIFGIIVEFEFNGRILHGMAVCVFYGDGDFPGFRIVRKHIHARIEIRLTGHLLISIIFSKAIGMNHHGTGRRNGEPSHIQFRVRFTGTEKIPLAIHPHFHPCVVVIGMGPTGRITLTGGDAHSPHGRNCESRFLAAPSQSRAHCGERGRGTCITGAIGNLLMTPMIHLQGCLIHGQSLQPWHQLCQKHFPRIVKILIVHTISQHIVAEDVLRNFLSPRKILPGRQRKSHLFQKELPVVISQITQRHVGIKKLQRLCFLYRQLLLIKNRKQGVIPLVHHLLTGFKIALYLLTICFIFKQHKMLAFRSHHDTEEKGDEGKCSKE